MKLEAEITNLKSFQKAMDQGDAVVAQGMYVGTRRSMARFRSEFLKKTPAEIRKGNVKANPKGQPGPTAGIGQRFRWVVHPENPNKSSWSVDHVKNMGDVTGSLFTASKAAERLETPGTRTAKGAWMGIPIALSGNPNTAKLRAGSKSYRAKPSWKTVRSILKRPGYEFKFQAKTGHTILWAKKKGKSRPFPVMLLVRSIHMKKEYLQFFELFEKFRPEVIRRFDESLNEAIRKLIKYVNKRTCIHRR